MPFLRPDLLLIHIPKVAGTSLEVAAGFDRQYPQLGLQPTRTVEDTELLFGAGLEHLAIQEVLVRIANRKLQPRIFAMLRDPVDRLISHFVWRFYRFAQNPPPISQMSHELEAFIQQEVLPLEKHPVFADPYQGFSYDGTPATLHPDDIVRHLVPQAAFVFSEGKLRINELYLFEDLAEVERMLHLDYGFPRKLPRRMAGHSREQLRKRLAPGIERRVRAVYAADDELLHSVMRAGEKERSA